MAALWVWLGGTASYLILAGQVSLDEVAAGVVLGGLGAAWQRAVLRDTARRFRFERPALGAVGGALLRFPGATIRVGTRLAEALRRDVAGRREERPFHRGRVADPRDAGRRAVVVLGTSLAPDSYALRLPLDEEVIAFHVLTGEAPGGDPRWPG